MRIFLLLISQFSVFFCQLKSDLAFLTRNDEKLSLFESFLNQWRVLLSRESLALAKPEKSTEDAKPSDEKISKPPQAPPSKSSSDPSKPPPDWNFGMFGPNPGPKGSAGSGRPIGGEQPPDQTKMLIYGALGFIAFVGALTYFEMGYKEISWKDFVNK